ncbi:MAG: RcgR family putative quorum lactone hydrolase [Bacteriovoracaceae bacterium]
MISKLQHYLKQRILQKEEKMAMEDDLFKYALKSPMVANPSLSELINWSKDQHQYSDQFFSHHGKNPVQLNRGRITFLSEVETDFSKNNLVTGDYFKTKSKSAVLILGHWNSSKETYNKLAKIYSRNGLSALRISLPYHDERRPLEMPIASGFMSSDLNRTIESFRQSVLDSRVAIKWLKEQGYEKIGIVGASLGSAVALLVSAQEKEISAMVGYLTAADIADTLWNGTATQYLKESLESDMSLDHLQKAWFCVNPINYLQNLSRPGFTLQVSWAEYDTICPPRLTQEMLARLEKHSVKVESFSYKCGHNTLAITPFIQLSGLRGIKFMRKKLL